MSCHSFEIDNGNIKGHLCLANIFKYKGFIFEYHPYGGYWPCHKDDWSIPRKNFPKGFWEMVDEFDKLTDEEKYNHQIYG